MNREIRFRGKHIHALPENKWMEGKWVEGLLADDDYINDRACEYMIDPDTICQYTGLKDDNGKEIFENDIVELCENINNIHWKAVVVFGNPNGTYDWGWQLVPIKAIDYSKEILLWIETETQTVSCKVVGNIFDNPELLEKVEGDKTDECE